MIYVPMPLMAALVVLALYTGGGAPASAEPVIATGPQITVERPKVERCKSARQATAYYRAKTWEWQSKRSAELSDKKPVVRGKSCHWSRYAASVWADRAAAARKSYQRWWRERGQVIRLLEQGLTGTPMAGTGVSMERHGRAHGVSPFFMAAVAAAESSLGAAACGPGGFNAWGLGNCGSAWSVPSFNSWDEAYAYYARFLANGWSGHTSPYSFRGYAACDECWARKVSEWMGRLFGVPARTAYP